MNRSCQIAILRFLKSYCLLISKDYHLDGLQVFLEILTLSIIGIDDTSLVTKIPKTSIKVFGSVEFVFWVFIVNVMLSTVKTARIPAVIQVVNHLVNRGYNILIPHLMQFWTSISKICLFLIYYFLFQSYHELALKPLILRPSRHIGGDVSTKN